jgi:ribosomal protein S18 acetylase RimI-like enzyme
MIDPEMKIVIRPYEPADRPEIRRICYETGFMGAPSDWYWRDFKSFADIWTGYYTDREPESTFVAVQEGKVLGYLLGCVDTRRAPSDAANILNQTFKRFLLVRSGTAGYLWRTIADLLRGTPIPSHEVDLELYPSHLHIDLLPEARGSGAGSALMHAWFDRLAKVRSPGCHLGTLGENTNGIAFFERMGFRRFAPPGLIPGMRDRDGGRIHDQIMVREMSDWNV